MRPTADADLRHLTKAGRRAGVLPSAVVFGDLERDRAQSAQVGYSQEQARRRISTMQEMFEDAEVTGYECLISSMGNQAEDRHVLAAAVRAGAHAIVTQNVKHFPLAALRPYGVELMTADEFLVN